MLYPISEPIANESDDLVGYINQSGELVVPPVYRGGAFFSEGLAAVMRDDYKAGFIDDRGSLVISPMYQGLAQFSEGLCAIGYYNSNCGTNQMGVIDHWGSWIMSPRPFLILDAFSEGLAVASLNGETMGYVDITGSYRIDSRYERANRFQCGLAAVYRNMRWGYIDRSGREVIAFHFDGPRAQPFTCGLAGVCYQGMWGFIDASGDWAIEPCFEDIRRFSEGYAPVKKNGKWGIISVFGKICVEFQYDEIGEPHDGFINAKMEEKAGFISNQGIWIIRPEYEYCYPFYGDLAVVKNLDKSSYSYITKPGKIVWTSEPFAMVQHPPSIRSI